MKGTLVFPSRTAPAAFKRSTAGASASARKPLKAGFPQVLGSPATSMDSLTVNGSPSSGNRSPAASASSARAAATRARSKSRTTTALIGPSPASIRSMAPSTSWREEISPRARAATVSVAER
jgi:hypothetical protein